jgi:hypothetical protein
MINEMEVTASIASAFDPEPSTAHVADLRRA